ncbi:triose-phosphate isomerase [Thalassotalea sp. 1_MG-2023]|uniref:triose-phosphate isomerase n=1 Tax=Thalassotalea sp. 1_MG-2023 TaxID=3062680 RepID=UPI0026E39AEE|nr:triose-phosphate isomerase [Thalassotalea sp. 1_MG-2023]MDO6426829.1 triose-phosphate isomerase [Thalassotalea sp. 1_MG-2023]
MNRSVIVAANWKMNGNLALIKEMTSALANVSLSSNTCVVVCPSFPYLSAFAQARVDKALDKKIMLGSQNASEHQQGAFTGEVSNSMLQEFGVNYVILGHSERRSINKETSTLVAHKVRSVLDAGMTPILCIGESEQERETGQTNVVLAAQLQPVIDEIGIEKFADVVIAYEPVWAIGTGKTASPELAQETHQYIRQFIADINQPIAEKLSILYGGSVNAANCQQLFAQSDIDGGLIGGASLKVDEFTKICSTV